MHANPNILPSDQLQNVHPCQYIICSVSLKHLPKPLKSHIQILESYVKPIQDFLKLWQGASISRSVSLSCPILSCLSSLKETSTKKMPVWQLYNAVETADHANLHTVMQYCSDWPNPKICSAENDQKGPVLNNLKWRSVEKCHTNFALIALISMETCLVLSFCLQP